MKKTNLFTEKIISDLDYSFIKNGQWVFPTIGFRFFNKDGRGLIASAIQSNEFLYELPLDFVIVGAYEYDGVAYLFLHNEVTGQGQVGTFPSPNLTSPGYTNIYVPLQNFDINGNIGDLTTDRFMFDTHHRVWVLGKLSYDESLDLYFNDFKNQDRVINSGFKRDGTSNGRTIKPDYFDGVLNLVPATRKEITCSNVLLENGGELQPGNYFMYVRYLVEDYSATSFVAEIGPVSVSSGDLLSTHAGQQEENWANGIKNYLDKKITLTLSNLDTNFKYLQVAVVRYSSTTENGPAQKDSYLVNEYFSIVGNSATIVISGKEPKTILSFDEILVSSLEYSISRTHTQINNRHLRGNLKKPFSKLYRTELIDFAKRIRIGEKNEIASWLLSDVLVGTNGGVDGYANYRNVRDRVGYFKGEIYPFGIVAKYTDGTFSDWFPCSGNMFNGTVEKGLYRFNQWSQMPKVGGRDSQAVLSAVTFDTIDAYNTYKDNEMWNIIDGFFFVRGDRIENLLYQGVSLQGFHSVAFQTNPTHVGGDPWMRGCSFGCRLYPDLDETSQTTEWNPDNADIIPLLRGHLPVSSQNNESDQDRGFYGIVSERDLGSGMSEGSHMGYLWAFPNKEWRNIQTSESTVHPRDGYFTSMLTEDNKHGIFSPDALFDTNAYIPKNAYINPLFRFSDQSSPTKKQLDSFLGRYPGPDRVYGPVTMNLVNNHPRDRMIKHNDTVYHPVQSTFVEKYSGRGELSFTSYLQGGRGFSMKSMNYNRNYGCSRYIGVADTDKTMKYIYGDINHEAISIVNVCKNQVDSDYLFSVNETFNVGTTFTSIISGMYKITDLINQPNDGYMIYRGDCFLQKTWMRTHRWLNIDNPLSITNKVGANGTGFASDAKDEDGTWYQFGLLVGIVTENKFNSEMRNDVVGLDSNDLRITYTFYPKSLSQSGNIWDFILIEPGNYAHEATQINPGYNKMLSDRRYIGYEATEPRKALTRPNRVDASDKHIAGAFIDGYRSIHFGTYQDYAIEDGPIVFIGKNLDYAFIVQEDGINQLYLEEQAIKQMESGSDAILGTSMSYFSDKTRKVSGFGSQHQSSIVNGTTGKFGFDFKRRIWWMLNTEQSTGGTFYLKGTPISNDLLISNEIKKLLSDYSLITNKTAELVDDPGNGSGIIGFSDTDNFEVGMTFLFRSEDGFYARTMIFNEKLGGFIGDYPFWSALYFNTIYGLFSTNSYFNNFQFKQGSKVFRHNFPGSVGNFYGEQKELCLSYIVNGAGEKEDNIQKIMKIFSSMELESKSELFDRIVFETQYQSSIFDFNTDKFWLKPKYQEHKWYLSIKPQTSGPMQAFNKGSEMRGFWMKVTIYFKGNRDPEIRSIDTDIDILTT